MMLDSKQLESIAQRSMLALMGNVAVCVATARGP